MISLEELAEIVFKGIGGKSRKSSDFPWEYPIKKLLLTNNDMQDFIFSWPDPCTFGLIVDAAEKLGYDWEFQRGWFSFVSWGKHWTPKFEWQKDNPMLAVCLAFKEVLELEEKL